jgi:hypothetical protein
MGIILLLIILALVFGGIGLLVEGLEALRGMVRAEAREELARRLAQVRERVADAGLDPATVDEAIEAARKVS